MKTQTRSPFLNRRILLITGALLLLAAAAAQVHRQPHLPPKAGATPEYTYRIVHTYPHDPAAFTQGLEFRAGYLYEGTGLRGRSTVRKVDLPSGKVLQETDVPAQFFGEGITVLSQHIVELTWQSHSGFIYDESSLQRTRNFQYPGEGWGLANNDQEIFMSDGTAQIRIWDPSSLAEERRLNVHDGARAIDQLNELEWVHGEIFANVWQTDRIVRISPTDGKVVGWIDLPGLLTPEERATADVLNGIAYDALGDRLFVTGKLWPKLFEIKLIRKPAPARKPR